MPVKVTLNRDAGSVPEASSQQCLAELHALGYSHAAIIGLVLPAGPEAAQTGGRITCLLHPSAAAPNCIP